MRLILNVIWLVLCGWWLAILYALAGILCFVLIITIPFGIAAFRIANYALWPFGRSIQLRRGAGPGSAIGNVLWLLLFGWWLAVGHLTAGITLCCTIIGIPLGIANFRLIPISLIPLGVEIVPSDQRYPGYRRLASVSRAPLREADPDLADAAGCASSRRCLTGSISVGGWSQLRGGHPQPRWAMGWHHVRTRPVGGGSLCGTEATEGIGAMDGIEDIDEESRVEVEITYDTSVAPHKADEPYLYVMYDAAKPEAGRLYFTQAEWDAFVLGVKDGEFDLDEDGNLPPVPEDQVRPDDDQGHGDNTEQ